MSITDTGPTDQARKRIVFVDDERNVLDALRDALRPQRRRWDMRFFSSGEDALQALADEDCEVIVSDLQMPGMDGAALLTQARELVPGAVRVVLSGHAELRVIVAVAGIAHQLLAKPCETEHLVRVIDRCCRVNDAIARVELQRSAIGATVLPSAPDAHMRLGEALGSDATSLETVTRILEEDVATTAKILQLANSAYFGVGRPVTQIADAVRLLGFETLEALVLQAGAFSQFRIDPPVPNFDLERLQRHSYRVGHLARALLHSGSPGKDAFTAGLLHDVGILVMAAQAPAQLTEILAQAVGRHRPLFEIERECCGVTHAEIGAHLLSLWGVPFPIASAVLTHHDPPEDATIHDEVTATYVANVLVEELESREGEAVLPPSKLDPAHLESCGLADKLPRWRALAAAELDRLP